MPPLIRVGAPERLAVEVDPEQPIDPGWVLGRFCLWVRGVPLGNQEDVATLRGVAAWWRDFVDDRRPRWDQRLAGLSAAAAFEVLHAAAFRGDAQDPVPDAFRFFVGELGMSAWDAYDVALIDEPEGRQRLLWRWRDGPVRAATFQSHALQDVGREFLAAWDAAGLPAPPRIGPHTV